MSNNPNASTDPVAQAVERLKVRAQYEEILAKQIEEQFGPENNKDVLRFAADLRLLLADHAKKTVAISRIVEIAQLTGDDRILNLAEGALIYPTPPALATPTTKEK